MARTSVEANGGLDAAESRSGERLRRVPSDTRGRGRSRVVIGIADVAFHQEVQDFVGRDPRVELVGAVSAAERLVPLVSSTQPDACVVCPVVGRGLRHPSHPGAQATLVVVAQEMTVPVLREAIDAGAGAVLAWPEERGELTRILARAGRFQATSDGHGHVIAVTGTRGGAGTTFVATHLAQAFAHRGSMVVLVDLDGSFADVTAALGIGPDDDVRTMADLVPVADELSQQHVTDALHRDPRGFAVLLAPPDPHRSDLRPGLYRGVVALLAGEFDPVIVHVPRALDDLARSGLELADDVVMVTTLDLLGLHGARRTLESIRELPRSGSQLAGPATHVVVNRIVRSSVTSKDLERVLGLRPAASISADDRVRRAQERGELVPPKGRGAARDIRRLATLLERGQS